MNKFTLIIVMLLAGSMSGQIKKSVITELTRNQIDSILIDKSKLNLTITDRMEQWSEMFLNMPYSLTCTGDGPYALYETEPLVNFEQTNCMVYCEHVLALSVSDSWDNFFNNLQQIRYKNGIIGMRTRNHYTMADWLPENDWLLNDVTEKIGKENIKEMTRTISHINFFKNKGISDLRYVKPDREIMIDYIPFSALKKVKENFKSGDILSLIFANKEGIFSAHMVMIFNINGKKIIRESSLSKMTTFDTPFNEWVEKYLKSKNYAGVSVMRVKDELNSPGKIILPWEISQIKTDPEKSIN